MSGFFKITDDFEAIIKGTVKDIVGISKIPTGWTNYVFKAVTKTNHAYVFRFPRNNFFAKALEKEIIFAKFIKDKINFATVNLEYKEHKGRGYSVHSFIDGFSLTEAYPLMNAQQKRILARDVAAYIATMQKVGDSLLASKIPAPCALPKFSDFLIGLAAVNSDPNYNYMEIFAPLLAQEKACNFLVHGDLNPGNIVVDKNYKMIAVLDYAFVSYSCNLIDLACTTARLPRDFRDIMIKEFEIATKTTVSGSELDALINIRFEVEMDYIRYMAVHHPDVELPSLQ